MNLGKLNLPNSLAVLNSNIQSAFGLNNWQLQNGMYNGCSFTIVTLAGTNQNIPIIQENPLYQAGVDVVANYNQIYGTNETGEDPNRVGQLYSTYLSTSSVSSNVSTGMVIKDLPNSDSVNVEDMGYSGEEFKFTLLFLGADYELALTNFKNAISNPPKDPTKYRVLVHPSRGVIKGEAIVTNWQEVETTQYWRGCMINITFRALDYNRQIKATELSTLQKISKALTSALNAIASLFGAVGMINGFIGNIKSGQFPGNNISSNQNTIITQTDLYNINILLQNLSNTMLNCTAYVYQNSGTIAVNSKLNNIVIDFSYLPSSLNFDTVYNISQGSIIMDFYYKKCLIAINKIKSYKLGANVNDIYVTIYTSISKLYAVCETIGNKLTYNTYLTPYIMSLRKVLIINNIPLVNINQVVSLNPTLPSSNYIPAGTLINLI